MKPMILNLDCILVLHGELENANDRDSDLIILGCSLDTMFLKALQVLIILNIGKIEEQLEISYNAGGQL